MPNYPKSPLFFFFLTGMGTVHFLSTGSYMMTYKNLEIFVYPKIINSIIKGHLNVFKSKPKSKDRILIYFEPTGIRPSG